jgi:3-oxoacyl-[acyl-carrier-protein] synthase-3
VARSTFHHARIGGIGAVVPAREIRLEDELRHFGGDGKKARRVTAISGIDRRRVADPGVLPSDLCQQAAENLFADMALDRSSIDALVFVSQFPDYALPATACCLQNRLGLPQSCAAFDVNQGCAGYVYGLWLAFSLVEARAAARVLLLAGDNMARLYDEDNRVVTPLFGDSGTATLIERAPKDAPAWFALGTDGSGAEALMLPAGGWRLPPPDTPEEYAPYCERLYDANGTPWRLNRLYMDGGAVFDFTLNVVPPHIKDLLKYADKTPDAIDRLVLHQANKQIMTIIAEKAGFPLEKTPMQTFGKYGNQSAASIPGALCDALGDELRSTRQTLLLSGYGVGLSWASAVLEIDRIPCAGVRDFILPKNHPASEDILRHWQDKIRNGGRH